MRLTLRTLLAYIDNILDAKDQEELAHRVASSDVAHDLLHRTQDATRRLRLPAPPVEASGPLADANTVAEYLDNTLPPADVTEFERRCLDLDTFPDADSHLAEVASCHHVLTMVLGQRAEIDPLSKQRMYALGKPAAPAVPAAAVAAAPSASPAVAAPVDHTSTVSEVPEYLRASQRSILGRLLPAIAALLLLGITLYFAVGPNGWLTEKPQVASSEGSPADGADPKQGTPPPVTPGDTATPDSTAGDEATPPQPETTQPETTPPTPPAPDAPGEGVAATGEEASGGPEMTPPAARPEDPVPPLAEQLFPDEPLVPETPAPETPDNGAIPGAETGTPGEGPEMTGAEPPTEPTPETPAVAGTTEEPVEPAEPEPPKRLGLVSSASDVLLRHSPQDGNWRRLGLREQVMPGDQLLSLPTYRPIVSLDPQVSLDLVDGALVDLSRLGESTPGVAVTYGRAMLTNTGNEPAEVSLAVGQRQGQLVLQPSAKLAVEVERKFQPGADPRETTSPLLAYCYAPKGGVQWDLEEQQVDATEPVMWRMSDQEVSDPQPYSQEPDWITDQQASGVNRVNEQASPRVASQLKVGEPIWAQLSAINKSSRKDERALATIFGVHVGQFDSSIQALRDEEQHLSWADEIEALRFAMSSSPDLAQAVHEELHRQHRQELADDLYEMLCGYSLQQVGATPEEWKVGAMRQLIDWLQSDQLDYRVLANYNLEQITGRRNVFNPAGTSGSREKNANRQRARLEDGDLKPAGLLSPAG